MTGALISHYRVFEILGEGGMGIVYRAHDTRLGRAVALKFLPESFCGNPVSRERFHREACAASAINHPNICTIYDVGEHEGKPFIAMELLEGEPLNKLLESGPLNVPEILDWAEKIADALEAAHSTSIIHRDIKPGNIFITTRREPKILDFGLAKLDYDRYTAAGANEDATVTAATEPGTMAGTVAYMSPEQARGERLDSRTDLFSLGVVLYEMATGKAAFAGSTSALVFDSILHRTPQRPSTISPQVPPELEGIIYKCLEKDRVLRYQTAADLRADLQRLRRDSASGTPAALQKFPSASTRMRYLATAAVLALIAAAALWLLARPKAVVKPREPKLTKITGNPPENAVTGAAISPDGKYLAYSDREGLHLMLMSTSESQLVPGTESLWPFDWSADGTRVLATYSFGELSGRTWSVPIIGGVPRAPTASGLLSRDGSVSIKYKEDNTVALADSRGLNERPIAGYDELYHPGTYPTWSPDGKHFAWMTHRDGKQGKAEDLAIEVVDTADGRHQTIFKPDPKQVASSLVWLRDNRIIFSTSTASNVGALWSISMDRNGARAAEPVQLTASNEYTPMFLSATADGSKLTFLRGRIQADVYTAAFDRRKMSLGPIRRLTMDDRNDIPTSWTSDSRSVIFDSTRRGTRDVYKQDIDSSQPEFLAKGPAVGARLADREWVMYRTFPEDPKAGLLIMRIPVRGGAPEKVYGSPFVQGIRCSQTPLCILAEAEGNTTRVSLFDPMKGPIREIAKVPNTFYLMDISPDAKQLAWAIAEHAKLNIIEILDIQSGARKRLVIPGVQALTGLDWMPDMSGFLSGEPLINGGNRIIFIDLQGRVRVLYDAKELQTKWAVASPDGTKLAILALTVDANVWTIESF